MPANWLGDHTQRAACSQCSRSHAHNALQQGQPCCMRLNQSCLRTHPLPSSHFTAACTPTQCPAAMCHARRPDMAADMGHTHAFLPSTPYSQRGNVCSSCPAGPAGPEDMHGMHAWQPNEHMTSLEPNTTVWFAVKCSSLCCPTRKQGQRSTPSATHATRPTSSLSKPIIGHTRRHHASSCKHVNKIPEHFRQL